MQKRIAYIAHPIGGNVEENLKSLRAVIYNINKYEKDTVPFCPYYADVVSLDDNDPLQRARGIANDVAILTRPGMVDELRLYGDRISAGMKEEAAIARAMGIPIICGSQKLYLEYESITQHLHPHGAIIHQNVPESLYKSTF